MTFDVASAWSWFRLEGSDRRRAAAPERRTATAPRPVEDSTGQLVTLGAQPGVGRSIVLEYITSHVARIHRTCVAYCSLEMTAAEVLQRTLAHTAGVDLTRLRRGTRDDRDWGAISQATGIIGQLPLRFQDSAPRP